MDVAKRGFFVFRKISKLENIMFQTGIGSAMEATVKTKKECITFLECIAFYMHMERGLIYIQIQ